MNWINLPPTWQLTPVGNPNWKDRVEAWQKVPYLTSWQTRPVPLKKIKRDLERGRCTGMGLLTGEISEGALAVDIDGPLPLAHFLKLSGGSLPRTVSWTSGKKDRQQLLFRVPKEYWPLLAGLNRKVIELGPTGSGGVCLEKQQLDFRWNGSQSVLPPSAHPTTGAYKWIHSPLDCEVAPAPTWLLDVLRDLISDHVPNYTTTTTMRKALGQKTQSLQQAKGFSTGSNSTCTSPVPLRRCLTRSDRDLIESGTAQGGRNDAGAKLARNLIGTAHHLELIGQIYEENPRQLFEQFCQRCTPSLASREVESIWKSAYNSHPTPTLSADVINNCIQRWTAQQYRRSTPMSNVQPYVKTAAGPSVASAQVATTSSPASGSQSVNLQSKMRDVNPGNSSPRRAYDNLDRFDLEPNTIESIKQIRSKRSRRLDLSKFLHADLAVPLKQVAAAKPTAPEMLLTTGLAVWTSLIGTSSVIELKNDYDSWREPAVLWTMNVAPSGSLKTPTQKVLLKPLWQLQENANRVYKRKLRNWKNQKAQVDASKKAARSSETETVLENLEPEPIPKEYWMGDATLEALAKSHAENPRGFLKFHDEIDGFFRSFNKYRGGSGDDEPNWLAMNDGSIPVKQNRVDRSRRIELSSSAVSITGSIQPETLAKYLGTDRDVTGMNARWIYCAAPMPLPKYTGEQVKIDIHRRLLDLYRKLAQLPAEFVQDPDEPEEEPELRPTVYTLRSDARDHFYYEWINPLVERWYAETHPGFKGVLAKWRGYCARIALALHCVNEVSKITNYQPGSPISIPTEITLETMKQAVALSQYYIDQAEALYKCNNKDPEDYTDAINILIDLSETKRQATGDGLITPGQVRQRTRKLGNSEKVKAFFQMLATPVDQGGLGVGEVVDTGRTTAWRYQPENSPPRVEPPTATPAPQTDPPSDHVPPESPPAKPEKSGPIPSIAPLTQPTATQTSSSPTTAIAPSEMPQTGSGSAQVCTEISQNPAIASKLPPMSTMEITTPAPFDQSTQKRDQFH